jgi:hypothetical protein
MTRRHPMSTDHLFMPVRRLEHFRGVVDYLDAHLETLLAARASKSEIETLDATIREMRVIVAESTIYPLDPPAPVQDEGQPWPLVPPGSEQIVREIFDEMVR